MSGFKTLSTAELDRRRDQGAIEQFWNVLTDDYFTGELIPGSRRVPLEEVGREARRLGLESDEEIVVYCSGGPECPQSRNAAEKLAALGLENVFDYEPGLKHWKASGHPVVEVEAAQEAVAG